MLKKYNTVLKWFRTSYEIQPLLLSTWISHLHRYPVMKCINHSLIRYQRVVCQFHVTSFWVVNVLRGECMSWAIRVRGRGPSSIHYFKPMMPRRSPKQAKKQKSSAVYKVGDNWQQLKSASIKLLWIDNAKFSSF